jgi:hypothetical protein
MHILKLWICDLDKEMAYSYTIRHIHPQYKFDFIQKNLILKFESKNKH